MSQMFEKEEARKILEVLGTGGNMSVGVIKSAPEATLWINPEDEGKAKKGSNMQVQVSLDGMRSFRLPWNTEAEKKLASMLVPGRQILFTFESFSKAEAKQRISTPSGGQANAPAQFTNYFGVDIIFVGKGEPVNALFDDELEADGAATVEVLVTERVSGRTKSGGLPEVGKGEAGGEGAAAGGEEY